MFSHYIRGPVRFLGKSGKVRQRSARPPPQNVSPSIRRGGACPSRQVSEWFRSTLRVSPLGRVSFPAMGKKPKDRRGRAPMGVPAHSRTSPRPPFTGVIPRPFCRSSGAQNMVPGFWFLPGHLALMRCKIPVCSSSPPRLVPTSRGRGCGIGGVPIGIAPKTRNSGPVSRPYGVFMTPFGSRGTDTVSRLRRSPYHA